MKKYSFNKLIRSKLPERMKQEGLNVRGRQLNDDEFYLELKNKMVEEAIEVRETENREDLVKELADILEVMDSLASLYNITKEEIVAEQSLKREVNGHFLPDNFVEYIEVSSDNHKVIEYLENRNRPYKCIV